MSSTSKDTIYIDIDDEITAVIEKVRTSPHKIVALVLPKRAAVFQSIVNMRLLKRTAHETKKNVVLITSEAGLLPLAGAVGLHVAKTLQTKPSIPAAPDAVSHPELVVNEEDEPEIDKDKSVGELAKLPAEESAAVEPEEAIDVDNTEAAEEDSAKPKKGKNKKLKIPNFNKFRLRLLLGGAGLILLIFAWVMAYVILPTAKITIKTDSSTVTSTINFTANTAAKNVDEAGLVIPAQSKDDKKTNTQKVSATGQKNVGDKAKGTMTLTNCINDGQSHTVPAGTSFSSNGITFTSDVAVTLDPALYSGQLCRSALFGLNKDVAVTAAQAGDSSNLGARSYTSSISGINAYGSVMAGGTNKIITVVAQQDVDNAKQQMSGKSADDAKTELQKSFQQAGLLSLPDTLNNDDPVVTSDPKVGDEASDITVTVVTNYHMLGVQQSDLSKLVTDDINKQIDKTKQSILDDGIGKGVFRLVDKKSATEMKLSLQVLASAGPNLKLDDIKKQIAGKKRGDTTQAILNRPGVKDVDVNYSPFWVYGTPKRTSRINITVQSPSTSNGNQ